MLKIVLMVLCGMLLTVLVPGVPLSSSAGQNNVYTFAVVPSAPPVTMHTLWAPFIGRLTRDTGLEFHLKLYEKMSEFEQDISKGVADFIFLNPLQAVVAHEAQGYAPMVRDSKLISAEIVVRRDSSIRTVDDLAGKKIAFVGGKNL